MRRILLTLSEDTTETQCGGCPHLGEPHGHWCSVWGALPIGRKRLPECIAAEAAAARMVEIAPEDARDGTVDAPQANREANPGAYMRVYKALRAHAAKAEVKP